jgi:transposase
MEAYSEDLRLRVVVAVDGGMPRREVERVFGVSRATIQRYVRRRRETGDLAPRPHRGPGGRAAAPPGGCPRCHPGRTLRLVRAGGRGAGLDRHDEPGHRQAPGLDPEKKTLSATERDEAARAAWRERVAGVEPTRFVFVDETGSHLGLVRLYARAPRGERALGSAPRNRGRAHTTITSLSLDGPGPGLLVEGGISTAGFEAYVEHILAPTLRPGRIVVMDNLRQHQGGRTRELIGARGAELWFLPSYSPDLNPIEEAFSKVKALLRTAAARTHEALAAAIWTALAAVTPADIRGYFAHCGYPTRLQLL